MSYTANIPQPNDFIDESQAQLLANFQSLDNTFGVNHYTFSSASPPSGKHKFVEMPVLAMKPTSAAGEGTLYTKTAGQSQLFFNPDNSAREYQLTRTIDASYSTFAAFANYAPPVANRFGGWTFLPGAMIFQYGIADIAANPTVTTIRFPVDYTTGVYSITLAKITADTATTGQEVRIKAGTQGLTGFGVVQSSSSSANQVYWMAIGI